MKLLPLVRSIACVIIVLFAASAVNGQTFQTISPMGTPRAFTTSVLLNDGTVLLLGGSPSNPSENAEIYNPVTQTFTPTASGLLAPLSGTAATLLNDGTVLVVGSVPVNPTQQDIANAAEIYNPQTKKFTATIGQMNVMRLYPSATLLPDGTVLVAGGIDVNGNDQNTAEIYTPAVTNNGVTVGGTFAPTPTTMQADRYWHTATFMRPGVTPGPLDNLVVLAGGADGSGNARNGVETYNYLTGQFSFLANMVVHRYGQVAYQTLEGNLVIAGGCINNTYDATGLAETYDPSTNSFSQLTNAMTTTRCFPAGTELADGTFLITGGTAGEHADTVNTSAEVFTPGANTFTAVDSMSTPAAGGSAVAFPFNLNGTTATVLVTGGVTEDTDQNVPQGTPTSTAEIYTYTPNVSIIDPAYQVTSIIYAPPGNLSSSGFTTSTSNGTTTTIGGSFTDGNQSTFTEGFKPAGTGPSLSESFGIASTFLHSNAFTETYTDATGASNQSSGGADAIDHNKDLFLIWLNPQAAVALNGSTPAGYSISVQGAVLPDIIKMPAENMMANGLGNTTIPYGFLNHQIDPVTLSQTPGLAAICAHVNAAEYAANQCTYTDQCGCRPSDFAPILALDPLIGKPGTADPLAVDGSGDSDCNILGSTNNTYPTYDCRYVPVPSSPGSNLQETPSLQGPTYMGGNYSPDPFTAMENTTDTTTFGGNTQESVGVSFKVGSPVFSFTIANTLTWMQSESTGTTTGSGSSQAVVLNSNSIGCIENISLYEDTAYHTFLFRQPPGNTTCGPAEAADTSLFISPQSVVAGGTVTLTATVIGSAGGPPTGSVQISSGTTVIGTATLNSSGVATLSMPSTGATPGSYPITASYLGSSSFPPSSSSAVNLNIVATPSGVTESAPEDVTTMNGNLADSIAVGDFAQNGNLDLAITYLEDNKLRTLAVGTGQINTYTVGHQPFDVVSGDLNGDGYPDLVTTNIADGTVSVLLNKGASGNGTFAAAVAYPVGHDPFQVAIGDLNGDGIPDLAVTNNGDSTVSILYGVAGGTFVAGPTLTTAAQPYGIVIGDFARTGNNDIAVTCYSTAQLYVFPNSGNGTFGSPNIYTTDSNPAGLVVGDFNGDGRLDIVTGNTIANDDSFFAGNGDGTFQAGVITPSYNFPDSIAAGDINGDGILDIVGVSPNADAVVVTYGVGDGTFGTVAQRILFPAGQQPWAVALGDFNKDGKLDIAVANNYNQVDLATLSDQQRWEQQYPPVSGGNPSVNIVLNTTNVPACSAPASAGVNVCLPGSGTTVNSPVQVVAAATVTGTIARMELWMDGVKTYTAYSSELLNTSVTLPAGSHRFAVVAVNTAGQTWETAINATVQ